MREGLEDLRRAGVRLGLGNFTAYLAEGLECDGAIAEALDTIELALLINLEERNLAPEALRTRGELHLRLAQPELAQHDFCNSIALAQEMGAKIWQLRSTTSLARMLAKQGTHEEARTMLSEIYGWFTDGFDLPDLKEARALLDELGK